ncbi:hypothetical protein ABEX25_26625 [Paenibacillus thiaminolyticus]|uniref:hypothetical protein n=1 Tax=Paenibacillus thiaminolyticus TaxID=49283 RepID=UPI003D2C8E11
MRCFSASRADPAGGTARRQTADRSEGSGYRSEGKRRNGPKASSGTERGQTAKRPVCEKWSGARAGAKRPEGEQRKGSPADGKVEYFAPPALYYVYERSLNLACIRSRNREGEGQMDTLHEFERHAEGAC